MAAKKRGSESPDGDILAHCVNCGAVLTAETGTLATPDWYRETRFVHYCKECQQTQFEDFVDRTGVDMAFYLCCAAYNLPFVPEAVPSRRNADGEAWGMYLENLSMLDRDVTDAGEPAAFSDGMTDLSKIFDGKVPQFPAFAGGLTTGGAAEKLEGTRAQRKNWGLTYTTAEYKELDRLYGIQTGKYADSGMDGEREYDVREICKLQLLYSQQLAAGGKIKEAKETYNIISRMRADQKKKEASAQTARIDTVITALERHGMARDGKLLSYNELLPILQADHAHYPMSHDMVDYILMAIVNTIRVNEGAGELAEVPVSLQVDAMFGELEPEMTAQERKLAEDMGLPPLRREKRSGGTKMEPNAPAVGKERNRAAQG